MKKVLTLILITLLLFGVLAPSTLMAKDCSIPNDFDYAGSVISFTMPDAFIATFDMDCDDIEFTQLYHALNCVDFSATVEKDGFFYELSLPVIWDFSTVDAYIPGNYSASGSICIPEGATLLDGLENKIYILIQVNNLVPPLSPETITLTAFDELDRMEAMAFATHTSQEELVEWFSDLVVGFRGYDKEGNSYDFVSNIWSLDAVDMATPGIYYTWATPDFGTEYILANGVSLPKQLCAVSIQTTGEPDINCCVSGRGFLHFPWVLSTKQLEQLDEFVVWMRQDGEAWTNLIDGFRFISMDFRLSQQILIYGNTYELKVTYPGGQTGVATFLYDGSLSIIDYSGGDRDGGDVNNGDSMSGTQPGPSTPNTTNNFDEGYYQSVDNNTIDSDNSSSQLNDITENLDPTLHEKQHEKQEFLSTPNEPQEKYEYFPIANKSPERQASSLEEDQYIPAASQKSIVSKNHKHYNNKNNLFIPTFVSDKPITKAPNVITESYSPTQTVISGLRLRDLCLDGENVVFGYDDLTVSIPSKLLLSMNLSDSDTLSVKLLQLVKNQILFAVEVSGKSITELTGSVLRISYITQSENTELTLQNEIGEQITDISYDGEILRFAANTTGTYTITELSNKQEVQRTIPALLPVAAGLVLSVGGIVLFRRIRHG